MVTLDCRAESRAGISLVTLVVENRTETARRVRVANRLDGAVWPPRREGVPEAGWDDGGFEGIVAPNESHALGYASPAPPADPPAELVWTERAATERRETELGTKASALVSATQRSRSDDSMAEADRTAETTPEGVVRALGDPRPPADAVPTGDDSGIAEDDVSRRSP